VVRCLILVSEYVTTSEQKKNLWQIARMPPNNCVAYCWH